MAAITNYYEELNLSAEMSIEEIDGKLTQLETVWNQRLFNEPEKATKMLALVSEARDKFSTQEAKRQYDLLLFDNSKETALQEEQDEGYKKWSIQAEEYYNNKQYDLAKAAIQKALSFVGATEDVEVLSISAKILNCCGEYDRALEYINNAIVINPKSATLYLIKAEIFKEKNDIQQCINEYNSATKVAEEQERGVVWGQFAYFLLHTVGEYVESKLCAEDAITYGDETGLGQKVLEELKKPVPVPIQGWHRHGTEKNVYEEKIKNLIDSLVSNVKMDSRLKCGWILSEKKYNVSADSVPSANFWGQKSCFKYYYVLGTDGQFHIYESENNGKWKLQGTVPTVVSESVFMAEFDFDGIVHWKTVTNGCIEATHEANRINYIDMILKEHPNASSYELYRLCEKGYGLFCKLNELVDKKIDPAILDTIENQRVQQQMNQEQEERRKQEQVNSWRQAGYCQYCGGTFKGLIKKTCSSCGRLKDY